MIESLAVNISPIRSIALGAADQHERLPQAGEHPRHELRVGR
jgi:hypothetical protein